MKRLRHPIRSAREPFGKAGLIVAIVALIAAIGGTAFAAAKLNSTQKKEVEKIAKKYAGKPGANGTNGAPGEKGAAGANGTNGTNGEKGEKGDPGSSVVVAGNASNSECHSGGKLYEVQGSGVKNKVCNGEPGVLHPGETLPSEATETGAWAFGPVASGPVHVAASFPIPLAAPLEGEEHVHYINPNNEEVIINEEFEEETRPSTACHGTVSAPSADPGNFCLYANNLEHVEGILAVVNPGTSEAPAAGTTGVVLYAHYNEGEAEGYGTWAVTAE